MKKLVIAFIICRTFVCVAWAQNTLGLPDIKSYTHTDYNASTEIWDINQDRNGILYFGNNDGLLTYDGTYWKIYPLPNKGPVRSLFIDASGRIFVGGQDEIGYFFPDESGVLKFHSIRNLLPRTAQQFAEILNIVPYKNEVIFRTVECLFEYNYKTMKTYDAPGGWRSLTVNGSQLFAEDSGTGLMIFNGSKWQLFNPFLQTYNLHVTGIMPYDKDTLLLTTLTKGLFLLTGAALTPKPTAIDASLLNERINSAKKIGDNRYAIGTSAKGLFIIDGGGKLIQHFSGNEGLQNNNIHSILLDRDNNLWLGLENGLDFINYNTSVKHIYPDKGNQLKSTAIRVFDQKLFIGTSNGLYFTAINAQLKDKSTGEGLFTEVAGTKGQVLSLTEIDHQLLMGHQDGAYIISNRKALPVIPWQGTWQLIPMPSSADIIAGTYTGLQLLKNTGTGFKDEGDISGIYESLANLALDNDQVIWSSHPYRGIFRIRLSVDRKKIVEYAKYTNKNGLPSNLNNRVYFIRNKVVAATGKGIYEYDKTHNSFEKSAFFNPIFADATIEYLTEDSRHNIWFISNQRVGVIDFNKPSGNAAYTVIYFPELVGQTVKGSEFIYPYDADNIFIGSNNGIFHLNYRQYVNTEARLSVLLTSVKAIAEKDSLVFGGYFMSNGRPGTTQNPKQVTQLSNHWDSFHFEYSSTLFAQKSNQEFSYMLVGFDKEWSKWSVKTEKDYTNLPYGKYMFSVKVRNNLGVGSAPVNYTFIVEPAWYQTIWAYLFYMLLFLFALYLLIKDQRRRIMHQQKIHEEEQRRLSYLHSLELDRNEKEIIALKNDKLETELNYKDKELATITMHLVDRGRILLNIKEELTTLIKKLQIPALAHEFRSIFKLLSDIDKKDDDWNTFAIYFDQVHNNFLSVMKAKYPSLSATDLKLCAYLRLNLSSKEIAQLLNISLKGVEISRYRVRKKLGLTTDINLYNFLIEVGNNG